MTKNSIQWNYLKGNSLGFILGTQGNIAKGMYKDIIIGISIPHLESPPQNKRKIYIIDNGKVESRYLDSNYSHKSLDKETIIKEFAKYLNVKISFSMEDILYTFSNAKITF
ncbi:MAG: hypothetical protein R3Y46_03675 [Opitutales bacterium]